MDQFDAIEREQARLYTEARSVLGESLRVHDALRGLYDSLWEFWCEHFPDVEEPHDFGVRVLLPLVRSELTRGLLATLRGHAVDAHGHVRQAVEACMFIRRMLDHPELAKTWANALANEASYRKFQRQFSGKKMFAGEDLRLLRLKDEYDHSSRVLHPTLMSIMKRMELSGALQHRVEIIEVQWREVNEPVLVEYFLAQIQIHSTIIGLLMAAFDKATSLDPSHWPTDFEGCNQTVNAEVSKWASFVESGLAPSMNPSESTQPDVPSRRGMAP